jgi:hypothetical protein
MKNELRVITKSGKDKKLSKLRKDDFEPVAGLGAGNQIILNQIARNEKNRKYRAKLKKKGLLLK